MNARKFLVALALAIGLTLGVLWLLASANPFAQAAPAADLRVCPSGCPYSTIQAALDAANPGDVIKVAQGNYGDMRTLASLNTATFTATQIAAITKSITLRGGYNNDFSLWNPSAYPTLLDAQGQGRVMAIVGAITPTIEGLRITGGRADGLGGIWRGGWTGHAGGGLYVYQATAVISGNHIYSNTAPLGGGAALFYSDAALNGNSIYSNAANDSGAGAYLERSPASLGQNAVHNNACAQGRGGGIGLTVSDAALDRNVVFSNTAYDLGGGISVDNSAATLSNNRVYSNTADQGGGLHVYNCANAVLSGNVITGNLAWHGGGIEIESGGPTLVNNVVADNRAGSHGAGIRVYRSMPRLLHTTIARNIALGGGDGSGVYVVGSFFNEHSSVTMTNTIIAGHSVGVSVTAGNTATLSATLWHSNTVAWSGNVIRANDRAGDPAFDADGYHLTAASMALDRGVDAGIIADIDGQGRPQGAGYDIGADEFPSAPPDVAWDKQIRVNTGAFQPWDAGPFMAAPGDDVTIVERVWITAAGSVSFTLGESWSLSLDWVGYQASTGAVAQIGRSAAWSVNAAGNAWHALTKTLHVLASPGYADTLTETLVVQSAAVQLPERIIEFQHPRPQPAWDKTVSVNGGAPQNWDTGPFMVHAGDTLTVVDRVWVTHTATISFTLTQAWNPGLALHNQMADVGTVITGSNTLTWQAQGEAAKQWHTLTTTLQISGNWLYGAITQTLTVEDAIPQPAQRSVDVINQSGAAGCYARINDGSTTFPTVQAAVDAAQAGDIVKVAGYCVGVNHHGGLAQVAYVDKSLTLCGGYTLTNWTTPNPMTYPTTLDAGGQGRALAIIGAVAPHIENLGLTGGNPAGLGPFAWGDVGGGIYINEATAVLSNVLVYSNTATHGGGGLFLHTGGLTLTHSTVSSNTSNSGDGAGVQLYQGIAYLGHNVIHHNHGQGWGGGVRIGAAHATLEGNTIANNSAGDYGGGVSVSAADAVLRNNLVLSNTADNDGGGIHLYWSAASLSGNVIQGNETLDRGGGVFILGNAGGKFPMLVNNAVIDNQALSLGPGVFILGSSPRLLHTTLSRNLGGDWSAIHVDNDTFNASHVALTNTIIANHGVGITVTAGNTATLNASLWHNIGAQWGGNVIHANDCKGDPVFRSDGYHIRGDSAAINKGVDAGVTSDIDGQARPQDGSYDLGADEAKAEFRIYLPLVLRH